MKNKLTIGSLLLSCGVLLFSGAELLAQGKGNGNEKGKHKEHYSQNQVTNPPTVNAGKKGKTAKAYKTKNKGANKFPHANPHHFKVPPGHYPPAGTYRIWYPGRPPGQQPAPVAYGYPPNAPITDGAFIIHGNQAYDTQYDWRKEEAKKPKSVPREIIDILFPGNTIPAQ
ncbi:hypothetical protein [Adhaeribacter terreus]|uniref:Uncharacterized protein n=1 Tax=Adhaeribacter terreus TaxID=529703 RepID=A0ABW0E6N4_9BACT